MGVNLSGSLNLPLSCGAILGKSPERLLASLRQTKTGRTHKDIDEAYRAYGFVSREGGKHLIYTHPEHPDAFATVTRGSGELDPGYVRSCVNLIERIINKGK